MPPSTHAAIASPTSGIFSETLRPFLNTPEPMTVPTTTAVVIHRPRTRGSDRDWVGCMTGDHTRGTTQTFLLLPPREGMRKLDGSPPAVLVLNLDQEPGGSERALR